MAVAPASAILSMLRDMMRRPEGAQDADKRFHLTLTSSISSVVPTVPCCPLVTTTEEIIVLSFNQQQLAHFQAFGFVVVCSMLDDRESAALTAEVTVALGAASGGIGTDTDPEGILSRRVAVEWLRLLGVLGAGDPR